MERAPTAFESGTLAKTRFLGFARKKIKKRSVVKKSVSNYPSPHASTRAKSARSADFVHPTIMPGRPPARIPAWLTAACLVVASAGTVRFRRLCRALALRSDVRASAGAWAWLALVTAYMANPEWVLRAWHVLCARARCLVLQLREIRNSGGSLLRWPETQWHMSSLAWLESRRLLDVYDCASRGVTGLAEGGVPHVDTGNMGGGGMGEMPSGDEPVLKQLVLIGGGHAHAFVLKMFGMKPMRSVRLVLITRDVMTPYSGMLPGHVAGLYTREECHIDVLRLGEFAGASVIHASAVGIDRKNKLVMLDKGYPPVPYDALSINVGCTPDTSGIRLSSPDAVTRVKPIDSFTSRWDALLERALRSDPSNLFRIVVVGGGAGGVELACAIRTRLERELRSVADAKSDRHIEMTLLTRGPCILSSHNTRVQATFVRILTQQRRIRVETGCEAIEAADGFIRCSNGKSFAYDECIWCTHAGAAAWLRSTGLALDDRGFIAVDDCLQSTNTPGVFAAGDCCHMVNYPRAKAGVFAVRAGPPLNRNLRCVLAGQAPLPYAPQSRFLGLIGTGSPDLCVASKGNLCVQGAWLWKLKDWIDRKWMADYTTALPGRKNQMMEKMSAGVKPPAAASGPAALALLRESVMRCGGCGSKVGGTVLSRVMKRLRAEKLLFSRPEVLVGLDAPDDAAVVAVPRQPGVALVHTVDFFRSFIGDPFVFGMVAANHALSDCHAMGADAVTALAVAVVPFSAKKLMEDTLFRMMAGACRVLAEAGCALVGGHTCEGHDMALGFAVNGTVDRKAAMGKGGLSVGDAIVLTKPIGTGALFAAHMRCAAPGSAVDAALKVMCTSNKKAAEILRKNGSRACTDVTGFGLVGHLHEMVKASVNTAAEVPNFLLIYFMHFFFLLFFFRVLTMRTCPAHHRYPCRHCLCFRVRQIASEMAFFHRFMTITRGSAVPWTCETPTQ